MTNGIAYLRFSSLTQCSNPRSNWSINAFQKKKNESTLNINSQIFKTFVNFTRCSSFCLNNIDENFLYQCRCICIQNHLHKFQFKIGFSGSQFHNEFNSKAHFYMTSVPVHWFVVGTPNTKKNQQPQNRLILIGNENPICPIPKQQCNAIQSAIATSKQKRIIRIVGTCLSAPVL